MLKRWLICAALLLMPLFFCTWTAEGGVPSDTLKPHVDAILHILQKPGYQNPSSRPPLRREIESELEKIFDFTEFSSRTAGRAWLSFTPDQKNRFTNAFRQLLLTTYLDKIQGYSGEQIEYVREISSQKGDRAEIQTIVTLSDGKQIPVSYRMLEKNSSWVVYDVIIENVSLIKNYRSQFQSILATGDAEQLIARVQARAQELKAASQAKP
ncbi:MAG: ABC transporter substrate-binding protein [Desulfovibrionaceae bacterium]|nr:ABC transporter substrate-binding protein [Desulfovibrionaceae bacterium]